MQHDQIEILFETYDFVIKNIVELEDEASFYLSSLDEMSELYYSEDVIDISKEDYQDFLNEGLQALRSLIALYNKHLLTIQEIESIDLENLPPERELTKTTLLELKKLTESLKKTMGDGQFLFERMSNKLS